MSGSRGFTLIELMVTIAVIAILASIAAPAFTQTMNLRQLDNANRAMSSSLMEARSRAATLKARVVVCPSKDNANPNAKITKQDCLGKVVPVLTAADIQNYIDQNRVQIVDVPSKVSVDSTSDLSVIFMPTGVAQAKKTFIFSAGGVSKVIDVTILGALNHTTRP